MHALLIAAASDARSQPRWAVATARGIERGIAVTKLLGGLAGSLVLLLGAAPYTAAPQTSRAVALGLFATLVASAVWTLASLRRRPGPPRHVAVQVAVELVVVVLLGVAHASHDHANVVLVLGLLPVAAALRFGPAGTVAVTGLLVVELPLRAWLLERAGAPVAVGALAVDLVPVLLLGTLAATLSWAGHREADRATEEAASAERRAAEGDALHRIALRGIDGVDRDLHDLGHEVARQVGLDHLALLRIVDGAPYVLSNLGFSRHVIDDEVTIDPGGPLETALRLGRPSLQRDDELVGVDTGVDGARAELAVPVVRDGRTVGALVAASRERNRFDTGTVDLLTRVAGQLGLLYAALDLVLERKRAAANYRALDRARDAVLGRVSEQVAAPLDVIGSVADRLHGHRDLAPAEMDELVGLLLSNAAYLEDLAGDVTTLYDVRRGELLADFSAVEMAPLLAEVVASTGHADRVSLVGRDDVVVHTDPAHLGEIVRHLVVNAIEHGAPPVIVRWGATDEHVVVRVVDHGTGIGPGHRARLAEPFGVGGDRRSGRGLGLEIVRGLAGVLSGTVDIEADGSEPCAVTVRLPARTRELVSTGQGEEQV